MSSISEKIRVALYAKLNVSGVTTLATGGIHYLHAPDDAETPYVVISRIPGKVKRVVIGGQILEDDLWQIKAVVTEGDSTTKEPMELAQDILQACETTINDTLTVSGNTVEYCKREFDIPGYPEGPTNDKWIYHEGYNLRTQTS